jgi:hypothetical protein
MMNTYAVIVECLKYCKKYEMRNTLRSIRYFDSFNYDLRTLIISDDREDFKVQLMIYWR